ncbi:hypothetical protein HUJ04_002235 [Dendroctonus ponderosae]|nr:hypothetical protein HUJ04_002234 [Dendroctonus ponderosae]KAH0999312.1 hypothetical protein HUJ04_002235 [Dendroctonus ponderosae]
MTMSGRLPEPDAVSKLSLPLGSASPPVLWGARRKSGNRKHYTQCKEAQHFPYTYFENFGPRRTPIF